MRISTGEKYKKGRALNIWFDDSEGKGKRLLLVLNPLAPNVTVAKDSFDNWLRTEKGDDKLMEFDNTYVIDIMPTFDDIFDILEKMFFNENQNGTLSNEKYLEIYNIIFKLREIKKEVC
jgi:hypothetical protein